VPGSGQGREWEWRRRLTGSLDLTSRQVFASSPGTCCLGSLIPGW